MTEKKSVTIEEADNGFIVRTFVHSDKASEPGQEKRVVCKTMGEAFAAVEDMMGGESESAKGSRLKAKMRDLKS